MAEYGLVVVKGLVLRLWWGDVDECGLIVVKWVVLELW